MSILLKTVLSQCREHALVLMAGLVFIGGVSTLLIAWALTTRSLYLDEAMERARGFTRTYQAYTEKLIHEIDLTLSLTARQVHEQGKIGPEQYRGVDDLLTGSLNHMPYVSGFIIINASGRVVHVSSNARAMRDRDVRERDFYAAHVGEKAVDFHVGRLFDSKLYPGQWRFSVSRVLRGPRGEFLGTVAALIDVQKLAHEYSVQLRNPEVSVTLIYLDGTVMSRAPYLADQIGQVLPSFARYKGDPPREYSFSNVSQVDQMRRLIAQRRFDQMPLLIAVTVLEKSAIQRWRDTLPAMGVLWALLMLVTVAVGMMVVRQHAGRQAVLMSLRQSEALLLQALAEKEVLLKEVYHRVKNNLQVVASLLTMQGVEAGKEAQALLEESAARVKSMALVHEQLYGSSDLAHIDLKSYLMPLLVNLRDVFSKGTDRVQIQTQMAADTLSLGIEQAIPLGLVINELLSNCFKHAYPGEREGRIVLRLDVLESGRILELEVADDGVGLPPDFDPRRQRSLGMRLVMSLAEQLDGHLVWGSHGAQGARFVLRLPLAEGDTPGMDGVRS